MSAFHTRFLLMALPLLLVGSKSFACDTIEISPLDLNSEEVVFIGTVADVTGPAQESNQDGPARLAIKLRKAVHVSSQEEVRKEYTVLLYGLGMDCSKSGFSKSAALRFFPPGTEVWVIGVADPQNSGVLEVWLGNGSYIRTNSAAERVDVRSKYDYCQERSFGPNPDKLAFELRKDLVRLHEATSEESKARILRRLAFHPEFRGWYADGQFGKLVKRHLDDEALIQGLMRFHEEKIKDRIAPPCSG